MITRKSIATALIIIAAAALAGEPASAAGWPGRAGHYVFEVTRNGTPIGTQSIDVTEDGDRVTAVTESTIAVKMLGVVIYRFHQIITETFDGRQLVALEAETKDPDGLRRVKLERDGDHWSGLVNKKPVSFDCDCLTSTMWQAASLDGNRIIEASEGERETITVTDRGSETLDLPEGRVPTQHFTVTGGIKREVWFDAAGNLVAAQQTGSDGSRIRQTLVSDPDGARLDGAEAVKP